MPKSPLSLKHHVQESFFERTLDIRIFSIREECNWQSMTATVPLSEGIFFVITIAINRKHCT